MSNEKINLVLIFGGRSGEHEVSLMSAQSVLSVLDPDRYNVICVGVTQEGQWVTGEDTLAALKARDFAGLTPVTLLPDPTSPTLFAARPGQPLEPLARVDVVFPLIHGSFGEDGALQGLLELAELAYVGAGVLGSAVGMDKGLSKEIMRAHGLPVVDWRIFTRGEIQKDPEAVIEAALRISGFPLFIKPANLGSSVGITKCRSRSDVYEGLLEAARFDRRVMVERGLDNPRELEVSVLGNESPVAAVVGEVLPADDFYSYEAKYFDDRSRLSIPAALDPELSERIRALAVRAFTVTDCAGMARVDFLLDRVTGQPYIGEINTIPGFTRISMYPKLWEAAGLSYSALIDRLIDLAIERKNERRQTERRYARS